MRALLFLLFAIKHYLYYHIKTSNHVANNYQNQFHFHKPLRFLPYYYLIILGIAVFYALHFNLICQTSNHLPSKSRSSSLLPLLHCWHPMASPAILPPANTALYALHNLKPGLAIGKTNQPQPAK